MTVPTAARPLLGTDDVVEYVGRVCFKTGPPGRVGIESEWLVLDASDPTLPVPLERTRAALGAACLPDPLPAGSLVSFEPGGQLELSTSPAADVDLACDALGRDLGDAAAALAGAGLRLAGLGTDPLRPPRRMLRTPRYDAMERFFDSAGPDGRVMMCSTAALQVCLDNGRDAAEVARRWHLVNALVPVLVAAFANSPRRLGRPTGWRSTRQAVWSAIDPPRTRAPLGADPVTAWASAALDARVLLVPRLDGPPLADPGLTLREWLAGGAPLPRPTEDDLARHLSLLFPPVRPRGWFEVRCVDALPDPWWRVPAAVVAALLDDGEAADRAAAAVEPVRALPGAGRVAAAVALADPVLRRAAVECFDAALAALPRLGAGVALRETVAAYADRYTVRGRCPADDVPDDGDPTSVTAPVTPARLEALR